MAAYISIDEVMKDDNKTTADVLAQVDRFDAFRKRIIDRLPNVKDQNVFFKKFVHDYEAQKCKVTL